MHGFVDDQRAHDVRAILPWVFAIAMFVVPLLGMLVLLEAGIHAGDGLVAPETLSPSPDAPPQPNRDR